MAIRTNLFAVIVALGAACSSDEGPDMTGVWHAQIEFDPTSRFVTAMRIDDASDGLETYLFGRTTTLSSMDDDVFQIDFRWVDDQLQEFRRTVTATEFSPERMVGTYESCNAEGCFVATFDASKVDPLDEPASSGVTLIAEYNGPATGAWTDNNNITVNVRVRDNYAYMARRFDGLRIVDISDRTRPVDVSHMPTAFTDFEHYNDVKLIDGPDGRVYAVVASSVRGAVVIDVTEPDAPVEVTAFPDPELAPDGVPDVHTLFIEDNRAYLAYLSSSSLLVYDLTDPTQPQPAGEFQHPDVSSLGGIVHDLFVEDGRAYLNYWNLGMVIVDTLVDPPVMVGEYRDYGDSTSHSSWVTRVGDRTIAVHGDEAYSAHVRIVDVDETSDQFLTTLGSYETREEISVHNIMAHENLAFVTYYQDGLRILDVSDPSNPALVGHFHTWPGHAEPGYGRSFYEGAIGVDYDPVSRTIYLADTARGLFILDLE